MTPQRKGCSAVRTKLALTFVVATAFLATAACSGGSSGGGGSQAAGVTAPATGTISYEAWTPTDKTLAQIVKDFKKKNPKVTVNTKLEPNADYLAALKSELASGTGPDVFALAPGAQFEQFSSFMEPLDDYASKSIGPNWKSKFDPNALARGQHDGKTLALPLGDGVAGIMWANVSLLKKYHLSVPKNYAELKTVSAQLKKHGIAGLALGAKDPFQDVDYFMAIANASSKDALYAAMEGKGKWTDPALVKAFGDWGSLFHDGVLQQGALGTQTYNDTYDLFLNQKAAFFANGSWNMDMFVNSAAKIGAFDVQVVPFTPPGADGPAPVTDDPTLIMVNKDAKDKAAAYKFAEFQAYGGGAQTLNNAFLDFSVLKPALQPTVTLTANAKKVRGEISALRTSSRAGYRSIPSSSVNDALAQALQGVAAGRQKPADAAKQVQTAADGN